MPVSWNFASGPRRNGTPGMRMFGSTAARSDLIAGVTGSSAMRISPRKSDSTPSCPEASGVGIQSVTVSGRMGLIRRSTLLPTGSPPGGGRGPVQLEARFLHLDITGHEHRRVGRHGRGDGGGIEKRGRRDDGEGAEQLLGSGHPGRWTAGLTRAAGLHEPGGGGEEGVGAV